MIENLIRKLQADGAEKLANTRYARIKKIKKADIASLLAGLTPDSPDEDFHKLLAIANSEAIESMGFNTGEEFSDESIVRISEQQAPNILEQWQESSEEEDLEDEDV